MRLDRQPTAGIDLIALIAMALAICTIVWAHVAVLGTGDIEDALSGKSLSSAAPHASHVRSARAQPVVASLNQ
jgi:hypothetical protein